MVTGLRLACDGLEILCDSHLVSLDAEEDLPPLSGDTFSGDLGGGNDPS
jgi:hypothetical protein